MAIFGADQGVAQKTPPKLAGSPRHSGVGAPRNIDKGKWLQTLKPLFFCNENPCCSGLGNDPWIPDQIGKNGMELYKLLHFAFMGSETALKLLTKQFNMPQSIT